MGVQKAIVAVVGGGVVLLNELFGVNVGIDPATVGPWINGVAGVLTPLLVWFTANK